MPATLKEILSEIEARGIDPQRLPPQYRAALEEARRREVPLRTSPPPTTLRSNTDRLIGAADTALTLGSGAVTEVGAGLSGIVEAAKSLPKFSSSSPSANIITSIAAPFLAGDDEPLQRGAEAVERNQGSIGPLTPQGEESLQNIAPAFQKLDELTTAAGSGVQDATGSTLGATATKTLLDTLPVALTGRRPKVDGTPLTMGQRSRDISELGRVAERQGVDLNADQATQREQIINTAQDRVGSQTVSGENLGDVQGAVVAARAREKEIVDNLFERARETGDDAGVSSTNFEPLKSAIDETLDGFDIEVPEMARVRNSVKQLEEFMSRDPNSIVTMNEIAKFQKRLNKESADPSVNAANRAIAGQTKAWLQGLYDRDMISGDPQALTNWRMANSAFSEFKDTFDENATVRRLHEQEATPEQVKQWIFGSGAVGAKKESGLVVEKIGEIVGRDSPEFNALRQEVLFDVLEPLLRETPSFNQFAKRYDRFRRNNPTLESQLIPDSEQALGELRNLAAAVERGETPTVSIDLSRGVAVAMFGHGIARQGFKVSLARQAIDAMTGRSNKTRQRQIMADMLGYDPSMPLIPVAPALAGGVVQTGIQETE